MRSRLQPLRSLLSSLNPLKCSSSLDCGDAYNVSKGNNHIMLASDVFFPVAWYLFDHFVSNFCVWTPLEICVLCAEGFDSLL